MPRILLVTSETLSADQIRRALPEHAAAGAEPAEVLIVVPALQDSGLRFWMSDADDAIARAEEVRQRTLRELDDAGVAAAAETGESDPETAIRDALETFAADRILIFSHPEGDRLYREDVDPGELEDRLGVPVTRVTAG